MGMRLVGYKMSTVATERQVATAHIAQIQFLHIMRASFSSRMFPGQNATIRAQNKTMQHLIVILARVRTVADMELSVAKQLLRSIRSIDYVNYVDLIRRVRRLPV